MSVLAIFFKKRCFSFHIHFKKATKLSANTTTLMSCTVKYHIYNWIASVMSEATELHNRCWRKNYLVHTYTYEYIWIFRTWHDLSLVLDHMREISINFLKKSKRIINYCPLKNSLYWFSAPLLLFCSAAYIGEIEQTLSSITTEN